MNALTNPLDQLRSAVQGICHEVANGSVTGNDVDPSFERPPQVEFGDYSTNASLLLASRLGMSPREVADMLKKRFSEQLGGDLTRVEVAGPGFVNLFLSDEWYTRALDTILVSGDSFGAGGGDAHSEEILVEFVSANPTGPLTAAGGRHAAYGDSLARILEFVGHKVGREFYVNDAGGQIERLARSIRARANDQAVPEDGYQGEYVADLAKAIPNISELTDDELALAGVEILLKDISATLTAFRVEFDRWFSERSLHAGSPNEIEIACQRLIDVGHTYRSEGALWLRSTDFGDDKDRVLQRANGEYTYFASDIAYHLDKHERGWQRAIDVFGADHHGYVDRMQAAFKALELGDDALEVIIMQFVNVIERGERSAMSKRRGDFVTLADLVRDIGVDAARYFMLQRSHDTTVDLDLDLAREQSSENPVYYVQYAHARIASMLEKATSAQVEAALATKHEIPELDPAERELIKKLLEFPDEVRHAAQRRAPHRIVVYVHELAQVFTIFYRDCRVVGADLQSVEQFRIALSVATKRVIGRSLDMLGVSAPKSM